MKKLQKVLAFALTCVVVGSILSFVGCKKESGSTYDCEICFDQGEIECLYCAGGICPRCNGKKRDDTRKCDICKGKGRLYDDDYNISECFRCHGYGTYVCITCDGKGKLPYCETCEDGYIECPKCTNG